jgi:hypothetical protein
MKHDLTVKDVWIMWAGAMLTVLHFKFVLPFAYDIWGITP